MAETESAAYTSFHSHVFLGEGHEKSERRTWAVIWLCAAMMLLEIVGGWLFGSIALIADGLHMSTHAGALLLAALAYTFARRYADDPRFTFGTGKLGDLAGFSSAIILAMIALLIAYEAVSRLFAPVPIHFAQAIPIAFLGLAVNVASAWLLSGGEHPGHTHGHHGHGHGSTHADHDESKRMTRHASESSGVNAKRRRREMVEDIVHRIFKIVRLLIRRQADASARALQQPRPVLGQRRRIAAKESYHGHQEHAEDRLDRHGTDGFSDGRAAHQGRP